MPVPEFEQPTVKLVVNVFSESGVPRTPIEHEPPAAMVEPQEFDEIVNTLGLLSEAVHPVAATDALVLLTVKVAVMGERADTVTFPRLWAVAGLTERVVVPEPVPEVVPPATGTVFV